MATPLRALPERDPAHPEPSGTVTLHFLRHEQLPHVQDPLRRDISAIAVTGRTMFAACDETASLERLVRTADGNYHQQESIALANLFDLPDGPTGEMDIEGLAIDGDTLWISGSHSRKRKDKGGDDDATVAGLATIERDPNRYFLGRLPLVAEAGGVHRVARAKKLEAKAAPASLKMEARGRNQLSKVLHRDPHLAAAVRVPSKENGLDVEGLAARGDRVLVGLRGPVIGDLAVVLELRVKTASPGRLKLRQCGPDRRRYVKHFLPLNGLGIRDLRFDGDHLLVLAGPTMSHDGVGSLFRWRPSLDQQRDRIYGSGDVIHVLDLLYERANDQAEGIDWVHQGDARRLLVVHDSPDGTRLPDDGEGLVADLFDLEQHRSGP